MVKHTVWSGRLPSVFLWPSDGIRYDCAECEGTWALTWNTQSTLLLYGTVTQSLWEFTSTFISVYNQCGCLVQSALFNIYTTAVEITPKLSEFRSQTTREWTNALWQTFYDTGSQFQQVRLGRTLGYNEQISLHQNHWHQRQKVKVKVMFLHVSVILQTPPPPQTPPLGRHTPLADISPQADAPRDGHCSGRYASHWNAFLLY